MQLQWIYTELSNSDSNLSCVSLLYLKALVSQHFWLVTLITGCLRSLRVIFHLRFLHLNSFESPGEIKKSTAPPVCWSSKLVAISRLTKFISKECFVLKKKSEWTILKWLQASGHKQNNSHQTAWKKWKHSRGSAISLCAECYFQ